MKSLTILAFNLFLISFSNSVFSQEELFFSEYETLYQTAQKALRGNQMVLFLIESEPKECSSPLGKLCIDCINSVKLQRYIVNHDFKNQTITIHHFFEFDSDNLLGKYYSKKFCVIAGKLVLDQYISTSMVIAERGYSTLPQRDKELTKLYRKTTDGANYPQVLRSEKKEEIIKHYTLLLLRFDVLGSEDRVVIR
jgi:hypothetical protein